MPCLPSTTTLPSSATRRNDSFAFANGVDRTAGLQRSSEIALHVCRDDGIVVQEVGEEG